jgi:hypothetical protein
LKYLSRAFSVKPSPRVLGEGFHFRAVLEEVAGEAELGQDDQVGPDALEPVNHLFAVVVGPPEEGAELVEADPHGWSASVIPGGSGGTIPTISAEVRLNGGLDPAEGAKSVCAEAAETCV